MNDMDILHIDLAERPNDSDLLFDGAWNYCASYVFESLSNGFSSWHFWLGQNYAGITYSPSIECKFPLRVPTIPKMERSYEIKI